MSKAKRTLFAGAMILLAVVLWAVVLDGMNHWFSNRMFEYQVKEGIDPVKLQLWATNLLATHGGGYEDFYGSNAPSSLKNIKSRYPGVRIFRPDEVWVLADRKGAAFLVVGPSSLATPTNQNISSWKPGIYFVRSSM